MQSFYGGRRGISFILKRAFSSIDEMNNFFAKGAETTSEVGYGEYVVINTSHEKDKENGDVYIRGFEGAEGPICNILGPVGNTPAIEITNKDNVSEYIKNNNASFSENYPDTWVYGEGAFNFGYGVTNTVYQLKVDESVIITQDEWNALSDYGKDNYAEDNSKSYIKVVSNYIHLNGYNIITKDKYRLLNAADKEYYSPCYISVLDPDVKISESTYNALTIVGKRDYKPYKYSSQDNIISEKEYAALSKWDQEDYEICYVEMIYGGKFISEPEYEELSDIDKVNYKPYISIFYLLSDSSQKINIYTYDRLTPTGKVDYRKVEYVKNRGLYKPETDKDSDIFYAYANVLDTNGNIQSSLIGFMFPFYQEKFFFRTISPYKNGVAYGDTDELPMTIHNGKDFNYYKEWSLDIPRGVKGTSIGNIFVAPDYAAAGTQVSNVEGATLSMNTYFTSFDLDSLGRPIYGKFESDNVTYQISLSALDTTGQIFYYWAEVVDYSRLEAGEKTYTKLGEYQSIRKVAIAESSGDGYNMYDLLILYSDSTHLGNIEYNGEIGWINAGNTRGKIQGLRVFTVFDSIADLNASIADEPSPEALAARLGITDPDNCAGWGVIALNELDPVTNEQTAALYFYDYNRKLWKKCVDKIGIGINDPESVLYISDVNGESTALDTLAEEGYWIVTKSIHRAY